MLYSAVGSAIPGPLRDELGHSIPAGWLAQAFMQLPHPRPSLKGAARTLLKFSRFGQRPVV